MAAQPLQLTETLATGRLRDNMSYTISRFSTIYYLDILGPLGSLVYTGRGDSEKEMRDELLRDWL